MVRHIESFVANARRSSRTSRDLIQIRGFSFAFRCRRTSTGIGSTVTVSFGQKLNTSGEAINLPVIDLYPALDGRPELFPHKVHLNPDGARLIAEAVPARLIAEQK